MENIKITKNDIGLQVEGFPDAAKVINLKGHKAKRLADLALHKADLEFANDCLIAIKSCTLKDRLMREALWRSAITHMFKCFGNSKSRFQLDKNRILKNEGSTAMIVFQYFKDLRDKHFIHDENSYTQGLPGAILNKKGKNKKIAKIVCLYVWAETLTPDNYSNLKTLVDKTQSWVLNQFNKLCSDIYENLENEPYEVLFSKEAMVFMPSDIDKINQKR